MIKNVDIRNYVDRILKKEQRGGVFNADDFNILLKMANQEHYDSEKSKLETTADVTNSLRGFIVQKYDTTDSNGYFNLSSLTTYPYGKLLRAQRLYTGSKYVKVDLVTQMEYEERTGNSITLPSDKYPTVRIEGNYLRFDPQVSKSIFISYLRTPAEPLLDFYYDANDQMVYLDEDETHALGADEVYVDENGVEQTPAYTITSRTVELDWTEDQDKIAIANRILSKMGITTQDTTLLQMITPEVSKQEVRI